MKRMTRITVAVASLLVFATIPAGAGMAKADQPGAYHRYVMKGSLLEVEGAEIYLCVGKRDGATVGQRLDVFRYSRDTTVNPKQGIRFKRVRVGSLEIRELVDEHYARATAVEGALTAGDIAELESPDK